MEFYNFVFPNCVSLIDTTNKPGQITATKEQILAFIQNSTNFPKLPSSSTTVDKKTISKFQWRVAESNTSTDYIAYEFNQDDPDQAKAALKRALARARLETYALPKRQAELMAFYHYVGIVTINNKSYYKFLFDSSLSTGVEPDAYKNWTFNKKIELGTAQFGTTAKVQHSYNHGEITGFYYPAGLEPEDFEQIILKTLTCFDLSLLPVPIINESTSTYYEFNKFSGEWEECGDDDLWIKNSSGVMINIKSLSNKELVTNRQKQGQTEAAIYKEVHLMNW